jgi:hypothetical protein
VSELRNEIQVLTADFNGQLDVLRGGKNALEKSLEAERTSKSQDSGPNQEPIIVSQEHFFCSTSYSFIHRLRFVRNATICLPKRNLG